MKKNDLNLALWFLVLVSLVFVSRWWFPLDSTMRMVSLTATFVASFFLLLNHQIKTFGKTLMVGEEGQAISEHDRKTVIHLLSWNQGFRRVMALMSILALAYLAWILKNIEQIQRPLDLYFYIAGWTLLCLIFDFQMKLHLLCNLLKKILARH